MGKILVSILVACAALAGVGVYYLQVYAYYDTLAPQGSYRVAVAGGTADLPIAGFEGIDSNSSPLRYRACFTVEGDLPDLVPYDEPTPLIAPGWFECFDAMQVGADLEAGVARGVLVEADAPHYGIDRVMALYPDGRAYVWPQFNACGEAYYEEDPLPEGCPPAPPY
ncbi:MAG: DUF6446 family protein [Pararhodobacter sp.]